MGEIEITDFTINPQLRELLVNYVLIQYEENAITDDEHLMREYKLLKSENRLNDLFEGECLSNEYDAANVSALT